MMYVISFRKFKEHCDCRVYTVFKWKCDNTDNPTTSIEDGICSAKYCPVLGGCKNVEHSEAFAMSGNNKLWKEVKK